MKPSVMREVDHSHAAATEFAFQAKRSDSRRPWNLWRQRRRSGSGKPDY